MFELHYKHMWKHLSEKGVKIPKIKSEEINEQVKPVLREMEKNGIRLDVEVVGKMCQKLEKRAKQLETEIYKIAGEKFNIASPSQMAEVLFSKMKLPTQDLKRTQSGFSTAASELIKIESKSKIIKPILEFREVMKLICTYLRPLPILVDENSRLHTNYGLETSTGRLNSTEPNLQNIPIKGAYGPLIRAAFVADKGNKLISADYSQIELRVVACLAQDETMMEAFRSGQDIHARTASEIFAIPIKKVSKDQRRLAKVVNFGVLYGMSPYGLSQALSIKQEEAAKYIERYFSIHSGIKDYCNRMIDEAREKGYVETLFGFRRYLQNIGSSNRYISESEERIAINAPVQGTAADILKLAMIELHQKLLAYEAKLLLTVHDELVVEAPVNEVKKVAKIVKDVMENVVHLCIPIEVDTGIGDNWAETK